MREKIARWIAPGFVQSLEERAGFNEEKVNQRVAEAVMHMDPFEPFLKKFHGIFSEQFVKPEDNLGSVGKLQLYSWAYRERDDPSFKHLTSWMENVQANNTLRKAKSDYEWFFGRAAIIMVELLVSEVSRLARQYEEIVMKKSESFDENLAAE